VLHFSIFCVFIGEGCDTLAENPVYTSWKESLEMMRNFGPKNVIPTVEGPDTLRKMSSSPMAGEKSWPKASTLLEILRNHL
jgi:hypothetical protein